MRNWVLYIAVLAMNLAGCNAPSEDALIAVATNFVSAASEIEAQFEKETGYEVTLVPGATGQLYAQIINGAPYDVFLAADRVRPLKLEAGGHTVADSRITYAIGQLALWGRGYSAISKQTLSENNFRYIALANAEVAPYGRAAEETIMSLGVFEALSPKIVRGENAGQTYGLIATGSAELGFVALSAVRAASHSQEGAYWVVPKNLHKPVKQDGVLLTRGKDNRAARAFLDYLKSDKAAAILTSYGYVTS